MCVCVYHERIIKCVRLLPYTRCQNRLRRNEKKSATPETHYIVYVYNAMHCCSTERARMGDREEEYYTLYRTHSSEFLFCRKPYGGTQ